MLYELSDAMYSTSYNQQRLMSQSQQRGGHASVSYSSQSVLTAVKHFVTAVDTMNETIMVPSRLLDMEIQTNKNRPLPELLRGDNDPYAVYGILNSTKNDLLYGLSVAEDEEESSDYIQRRNRRRGEECYSDRWSSPCESRTPETTTVPATSSSKQQSPPTRRESTLSMMSVASTSSSDSNAESDIAEESQDTTSEGSDSALGQEDSSSVTSTTAVTKVAPVNSVADASVHLRSHLIGLYSCLSQLSDSAEYLTDRYQEDIAH